MKLIKDNLVYILGVLIVLVSLKAVISSKHQKELLEVARVHQFIGCMQVSGGNSLLCSKIVAVTPQVKLIETILDSKADDGKLIIEHSKEPNQFNPQPKDDNGTSI